MIADAGAISRLTVIASPDTINTINEILSKHSLGHEASVVTDMPSELSQYALYATVSQVYVRHLFINAIKKRKQDFGNASLLGLTRPSDMKSAEEFTSRDSYVEGRTILLRYIYRPAARKLATLLIPTPVTPNMITLVSLLLIPLAATFTIFENLGSAVTAAIVVQVIWMLDLVDGYLARLKSTRSNFGYWFDTMVDTSFDATMAVAFTIGAIVATGDMIYAIFGGIWLVGYTATHSDSLIRTAAGTSNCVPIRAPIRPPLMEKAGATLTWYTASRIRWALGQPDVLVTVFTIGLLLQAESAVVILFATYYTYSMVRMFIDAYRQYRNTELND